jgi:ethanolamine utilization protein EutQ
MSVRHFTPQDAEWYQYSDRQLFVGDVLDSSNSKTMSVGFYRNRIKGDRNEWVVTYDEALIVTTGALTVRWAEGVKMAKDTNDVTSQA